MENEAIENYENSEWNPIVANDKWRIENWILEELHHTFSGEQVPFPNKMLPTKYTDEKKDGGNNPCHNDHHKYLKIKHIL